MDAVLALILVGRCGVNRPYSFIISSIDTKNITLSQISCSESMNRDGTLPYEYIRQTTQVEKKLTTHSIYLLISNVNLDLLYTINRSRFLFSDII